MNTALIEHTYSKQNDTADRVVVLLVEDDLLQCENQRRILSRLGFSVVCANHGLDSIELLNNGLKPNIILMDMDLGDGLDGAETARLILNSFKLPIVFLTSHSDLETVNKVKCVTRYGYVVKNSGEFVLLSTIEIALELFRSHQKLLSLQKEMDYRVFIQNITAAIIVFKPDISIISCNQGAEKMWGYSQEEVKKKNLIERGGYFLKENGEKVSYEELPVNKVIKTKKASLNNVLRLFSPARKEMIWINLDAMPVFDSENNLSNIVVTINDISELKHANKIISDKETKFRFLSDRIKAGIIVYTVGQGYTNCNKEAEEILQTPFSNLLNKTVPNLNWIFYDENDKIIRFENLPINRILKNGKDIENLVMGLKLSENKPIIWMLSHFQVIHGSDGSIFQILITMVDITKQKIEQNILKASEERYRSLVDKTQAGIIVHNADTCITDCNEFAEELMGLSRSQMQGKQAINDDWCFFWPDGSDMDQKDFPVNVVLATRKPLRNYVLKVQRKVNDIIWVSADADPVYDEHGIIKQIITTNFDVTHLKRTELELRNQLEEKETLLKEVHHRIKNNITSIISLLQLQCNQIKEAAALPPIREALSQLNSMRVLYDKLLLNDDYSQVSLNDYLCSLTNSIMELFPDSKYVQIKYDLEPVQLNTKQLFAVGVMVNEIFTNIFKYAFRGRSEGLVVLALKKMDQRILLTIQDNGIGLSDTKSPNSTGFGLLIVNMLTKQLQGTFTMENRQGTYCSLEFEADLPG